MSNNVLVLQVIHNDMMFQERYELETTTVFELINTLALAGINNCNYIMQKDVIKDRDLLQQKCASLQQKLVELSTADVKEQSAINAINAELSGHSSHLKAKNAKINRHTAFYLGTTQAYLITNNDDIMQPVMTFVYKDLLNEFDGFYSYISEVFKIDANKFTASGFKILPIVLSDKNKVEEKEVILEIAKEQKKKPVLKIKSE